MSIFHNIKLSKIISWNQLRTALTSYLSCCSDLWIFLTSMVWRWRLSKKGLPPTYFCLALGSPWADLVKQQHVYIMNHEYILYPYQVSSKSIKRFWWRNFTGTAYRFSNYLSDHMPLARLLFYHVYRCNWFVAEDLITGREDKSEWQDKSERSL